MRGWSVLLFAGLVACASTRADSEVTVRKQEKLKVAQSGFLPGRATPPQERNGISIQDTGSILFVCANSPQHEDREVLIRTCSKCSEKDYFFFDRAAEQFRCYACETLTPNESIKCELCGKQPRRIRTKNQGH